jgi:hypothetical protein
MTNEQLQQVTKVIVKSFTSSTQELSVWVSQSYIESRRAKETVSIVCQHDFNPDIWIVEHKDGTEGAYFNTELGGGSL